jgi:hypothetical protein
MKKYTIPFLLITVFMLAGCGNKEVNITRNKSDNGNQNQTQMEVATGTQERIVGQEAQWSENFTEASSTILAIGDKVFVVGAENTDGSISAERIMIGNSDTNWEELTESSIMPQGQTGGVAKTDQAQIAQGTGNNVQGGQMQPSQGGKGSAPADFQNLSDEEKQAIMKERGAQGGPRGIATSGTNKNILQLSGEIISKDDSSFTLKIIDGGSKIIFFSSNSQILKIK